MAFKPINTAEADSTISLGGTNRKTNKVNPTSIEGYYLGSKRVDDAKKKCGFSHIHVFQTPKGNIGVWGKTDMDRKVLTIAPGTMTRVAFDKMRPTANGDMYVFAVAVDAENTIEVATAPAQSSIAEESEVADYDTSSFAEVEETDLDADDQALDVAPPARPQPPKVAAKAPDPARAAKVAALLNRNKTA